VSKPRLLLVEDDTSVREGLCSALTAQDYEVIALRDGHGFGAAVDEHHPDLAILDIALGPGPDGFELARQLRAGGTTPFLFLTAADSVDDRVAGFDIGADDYLVKPFSVRELVVRIRAVLRRTGRLPQPVLQIADLTVDTTRGQASRAGFVLALTPTELSVLSTLAREPGRVWSKAELLHEIWQYDAYDAHLVEVHVSSLRRKLEAHGSRLIHTERAGAYSLRP